MDRWPYDIQAAVTTTHTSCFRQILNPLFDLYYVLEIITFGNYNGLDAGPLTLLSPYILSLVNANGPTHNWTHVVKLSACPPKQYLNGKDSRPSSRKMKKAQIDSSSDNNGVYNKPFIFIISGVLPWMLNSPPPPPPGPDGIYNSLLKHLPEDTIKPSKRS